MSIERNRFEADRWLRTALDDLDAASILLRNRKHAHACFHARQAGEKALKALWYASDADPWGHSIKKLIDDLECVDPDLREALADLDRSALYLDRFYVPTRYPNGLPEITPDVAFTNEDAKRPASSTPGASWTGCGTSWSGPADPPGGALPPANPALHG